MNGTLKRAAVACMLMFALLMLNVNYIQVIQAEDLRTDSRNNRNFYARYDVERGRITAGDKVLAESVRNKGSQSHLFAFTRRYPEAETYAHVTGFFAPENETEIERAHNTLLNGTHPDLLIRRGIDLLNSQQSKGANVDLTIMPKAQEAAYKALAQSGKRGAVVAMNPKTGAILALVSLPSYDPNKLSEPNKENVNKASKVYEKDKGSPLLNRAINQSYPPGSTFKVVTAAAFLEKDDSRGAQTQVEAPTRLALPGTNISLPNSGNSACGSGQVSLVYALEVSCNTPFGKIGLDLGYDAMNEQMQKFGAGEELEIPMKVSGSSIGKKEDDPAAIAMTSIGQRSTTMTPLQMAMVAAGIANNGVVMKPYLVNEIADSEGTEIEKADPDELSTAVTEDTARKLREMMVSVVNNGTARLAQIPGVQVGGKTGTAETSGGRAPHAWFISFAGASVDEPEVAVSVIVESGSAGTEASGGQTAAPIAKAVMSAVLGR
ncbi:peptidoglycan D,D-transpeptidase FtsI family protein [Sinosporangium siamense]|uniref:Penicillin-binding protein PbpA n=1 Tax=Sinosporangium siamense TaxID=1367973 RepID=A0A919V9X2_9ACTN|nr:penicillin-binding transpeptidase domain-containing protein [Sinosporangium siamense]GII95853.1 putative penicillin-binding protein PbpA [Sinosporangium siamense]